MDDENENEDFPAEVLNTLSVSGLPDHELKLKEGSLSLLVISKVVSMIGMIQQCWNKNLTKDDTNKVLFLYVFIYVYTYVSTMFTHMFAPCSHLC